MKNYFFKSCTLLLLGIFCILASCSKNDNGNLTPTVKLLPRNDYEGTGENKMLDVTVTLSPAADVPVTITYSTVDSTAVGNKDFIPITDATLVFQPGETSKTIQVEIISDSVIEFTEAFKIQINSVQNAEGSGLSLPITIYDDDSLDITQVADGFISPDSYRNMYLFYDDEFNDSSVNINKWSYDVGEGIWADQWQEYTSNPDNIRESGGLLKITARNNSGHYTSGRINSASTHPFKYGLVEIRAKFPKGTGLWPSVWLLGSSYNGTNWPLCGEMDIATLKGQVPGQMIGSAFYDITDPVRKDGFYTLPGYGETFADEFHVFSILWQQDKIDWYVDNKKYLELNKSELGSGWPFNDYFGLYISFAVGGSFVGPPNDSTVFPQTFELDYVRGFIPSR